MENELAPIIESIGRLNDCAEASRWQVCSAIASAFDELPAYSRGLTAGLCARMHKSTDQIYCLRDSERLRANLRYDTVLSPSIFSTLFHLRDRYNLDDNACREWLDWVKETGASVRDMSQEITTKYTEDSNKAFIKRAMRVQKDVQRLWEDMELIGLPDSIRAVTRAALIVLKEWITALLEWRDSPPSI
jgi:hypothetical protein